MYLNIVEYVGEDKQDELLEMIDMDRKCEGIIAQIKKEAEENAFKKGEKDGFKKGEENGQRDIIKTLLKTLSLNDVARYLHKDESEILKILKSVD